MSIRWYWGACIAGLWLVSCSSNKLSEWDRLSIQTVSVEQPVLREPLPWVVAHLPSGDPSYGSEEFANLSQMHKSIYEQNGIDIKNIVFRALLEQIQAKQGRLQLVEASGDLIIGSEIISYGFASSSPFAIAQKPVLEIRIFAHNRGNKRLLDTKVSITPWSRSTVAVDPFRLVRNPILIKRQLQSTSNLAVANGLEAYEHLSDYHGIVFQRALK